MSRHGYDPFGSDEAMDVQDHLHGLADPLPVLVQVLEAVHAEDSLILPAVAEAGLAAAGEVALLLDPALDPSFPRLPVPVDDRLRTIALEVMESLVQPWDRRTGACCLYGLWRDPDGDAHYRRALEPYLRALAAGARTCLDPPHDPGYSWTGLPPRDARRARADDEERPGPFAGNERRAEAARLSALAHAPAEQALVRRLGLPAHEARRLAGAFVRAARTLADGLRHDAAALGDGAPADEGHRVRTLAELGPHRVRALAELPWPYAGAYDAAFTRRFLATVEDVGHRLATKGRLRPKTVAEDLALLLVVRHAVELAPVCEPERAEAAAGPAGRLSGALATPPSAYRLARVLPRLAHLRTFPEPVRIPPDRWFSPPARPAAGRSASPA
ncbi:hypothetical protein [Nonomuraea sp. NPDC049725]|uniref:hypothetical protein n=1 Tax=Nonomuraea sp. NPDC049725 TaxID=3154508 RepID=UPI00343B98EB